MAIRCGVARMEERDDSAVPFSLDPGDMIT